MSIQGESGDGRPAGEEEARAVPERWRRLKFALLRASGLPFVVRETLQRRRVTILVIHEADPGSLRRHLVLLKQWYNIVSLRQCVDALESGRLDELPPKPLAVTIDDGLRSNRALLDTFRDLGVQPTVFLVSGVVDTHRWFWWMVPDGTQHVEQLKAMSDESRLRELAALGYTETTVFPVRHALSRDEIEDMRDVVDFQSHSVNHPILPRCTDERAWSEIADSKRDLEQTFGFDVYAFAYPNGDFSERDVEYAARAGYRSGLGIIPGLNGPQADLFRLKRIAIDTAASSSETLVRASGVPSYLGRLFRPRRWLALRS